MLTRQWCLLFLAVVHPAPGIQAYENLDHSHHTVGEKLRKKKKGLKNLNETDSTLTLGRVNVLVTPFIQQYRES